MLNFNSSRVRLLQENEAFAAQVPAGAYVLDAGAGSAPYRHLFIHTNYESADFEKVDKVYAHQTYTCDLARIPVSDGRFDFVVFNQVMEHLPEPRAVLAELFRVMKPEGKMIYTAPLFYEEHEQPYDFYRYTQFGVRHLLEQAGFIIERLDWLEGYFSTVAYQFNTTARYLPLAPAAYGSGPMAYLHTPIAFMVKSFCALASIYFHRIEVRNKFTAKGYPKNFVAVAVKPQEKDKL